MLLMLSILMMDKIAAIVSHLNTWISVVISIVVMRYITKLVAAFIMTTFYLFYHLVRRYGILMIL